MSVGRLVLPRGTVGITDASATRRPATPMHAAFRIDNRIRIVARAHPARAADVERAGDVGANVLGEQVVVRHKIGERTRAAGQQAQPVVAERAG